MTAQQRFVVQSGRSHVSPLEVAVGANLAFALVSDSETQGEHKVRPYETPYAIALIVQSSFSGASPMFFSPAAFFSWYFFAQVSQLFPAAVSRPVKARRAMSA